MSFGNLVCRESLLCRESNWRSLWFFKIGAQVCSVNHGELGLDIKDMKNWQMVSPHVRLWSSVLTMAIRDLWSKDPDISRSARDYVYKDDQSAANSFDNIMDALGYNPERFRELMLQKDARKRLRRMFVGMDSAYTRQHHRVRS